MYVCGCEHICECVCIIQCVCVCEHVCECVYMCECVYKFVGSCLATKVFIGNLPAMHGKGVGHHKAGQ